MAKSDHFFDRAEAVPPDYNDYQRERLKRELIAAAKAETNHYDNGWGGSAWEDECRQRLQKLRTICRALISLEGESLEGE